VGAEQRFGERGKRFGISGLSGHRAALSANG